MKALSIRQPWAWAILHAGKDVENRVWSTEHRGPLLIHAAQALYPEFHAAVEDILTLRPDLRGRIPGKDIERGGIVGIVEVTACVQESESCGSPGPTASSSRTRGPLELRRMRGALGLFEAGEP